MHLKNKALYSKILKTPFKLIVTSVVISFFYNTNAQISNLPNNVKGVWKLPGETEAKNFKWSAHWIWLPNKDNATVMLARKKFKLTEEPKQTTLRITASSKYELTINNTYINQGPARSAPHHQSYDILDISSMLKKGENTIAIKVHFQKEKQSYHQAGRAGLLAQLNSENLELKTDTSWKVLADPTWNAKEDLISRFQMQVNDHVDLTKALGNWKSINFDDSNWHSPEALKRTDGWPIPKKSDPPTTFINPWVSLVPRDIPYLKEKFVGAPKIVKNLQLSDEQLKDILSKKGIQIKLDSPKDVKLPQTIKSTSNNTFILYDFGTVVNGMPKLELKGTKNTKVHILSAPYIVHNTFTQHIIASKFHDQICLSGDLDSWQSMYFKPARYLAVLIEGASDIQLKNVGIHNISYPFELKGTINIPEATWLEELWYASAKTIAVATTDAYTDNYRERRQYAQTGYYAALGNYFTFGDHALQRRYLMQTSQEQEPNGLMPAYAPLATKDFMVILDSNCLWIRSLYNYYLYSGDEITLRHLLPRAKELMELLHSFTNHLGMIDNPPYAYWLDHTLNDRNGANTNLNGHYLGALKDFHQLLNWLQQESSEVYGQRAEKLSASMQRYLWSEEKGLFADAYINGKLSTQFSEHANAMTLGENIATQDQANRIIEQLLTEDKHNFIKRENGITMVTPAMSYFLHKGIANYGYEDASLNKLYNRFRHMLDPTTNQTLWEEWWLDGTGRSGKFVGGRTRSDAQTESVFPPALITEFIFGIKPTAPGMTIMNLKKPNTSLKNIKGVIPTPRGNVCISWNLNQKEKLHLIIPEGMKIVLDTISFNTQNIVINNKKAAINTDKTITLKSGEYSIRF
ncbi:hypothetical protein KH5_15930 [Urechidicola sp. KH5]